MEFKKLTGKAKIEKARKRVGDSLNVFKKAYVEVESSIKDLESVVEESTENVVRLNAKIREEEDSRDTALSEIEANKGLLKKFSEFLPLTSDSK